MFRQSAVFFIFLISFVNILLSVPVKKAYETVDGKLHQKIEVSNENGTDECTELSGICVEECSDHSDCDYGLFCCYTGCGHICQKGWEDPTAGGDTPQNSKHDKRATPAL